MGQSPNSKNYTNNPRDNILVQGNADLYNNRVLKRTFTTEVTKIADRNDILISVRVPVGDIARNQYESIVIGRGIAAIKGNNFLYYQLEKMNNSGFWKKYIAGSTFESITGKDLKSSDIYISNHKEEKSIGDIFQTLTKTIQLHERKCEELALIKKALLQKLFPKKDEFKPEVRYKNFSDAWEQRKLGEVTEYIKGFAFKSKDYKKSGHRIIRVSDLGKDSIINNNDSIFVTDEISKQQNKYKINKNEIIITTVGSKAELKESAVGRPIIVRNSLGYLLNQNLVKIHGKNNKDSRFIYYQLLQPRYSQYIATIQRGNANQANIAISDLWNYRIFITKHNEQQKIGNFFQQLDFLITLHQRKLEKLKQLKKFLLQNMFI